MNPIGFGESKSDWEGPLVLDFSRTTDHAKTVRYRCQLKFHAFDLYAPLFMLRNLTPGDVPTRLLVAIGKSFEPVRTIGFLSGPRPLRVESDVCQFEFKEAKVNSKRYDLVHQGQPYSLYIPNEVFENHRHPTRVYLRIGVPDKE
jgi:hypothetical protein